MPQLQLTRRSQPPYPWPLSKRSRVSQNGHYRPRHSATNCRQAERIAGPLSLRKSAIVLKSGASRPVSHIISTLRAVSRSRRRTRLDLVDVAVDVDLQRRGGMIGRAARRLRHDARKPQRMQIQFVDEDVDHPHRIVFSHVIVEDLREQNALRSVFALNKALHQEPELNASRF